VATAPAIFLACVVFSLQTGLSKTMLLLLLVEKVALFGPVAANKVDVVWGCLACLFSGTLLRRLFAIGPSSNERLENHCELAKASFTYRIFKHVL
jgi:hypothetical protein